MKTIELVGARGVGKSTLVSDDDFEWLSRFTWRLDANGYVYTTKPFHMTMHRAVVGLSRYDPLLVDHRDRNSLNNQRGNLRFASTKQNAWNADHRRFGRKYIGVRYDGSLYRVVYRGELQRGFYTKAEDAAREWNRLALAERGEFAVLNEVAS